MNFRTILIQILIQLLQDYGTEEPKIKPIPTDVLSSVNIVQANLKIYADLLKWSIVVTGALLAYLIPPKTMIYNIFFSLNCKAGQCDQIASSWRKIIHFSFLNAVLFLIPVTILSWSFIRFSQFEKIIAGVTVEGWGRSKIESRFDKWTFEHNFAFILISCFVMLVVIVFGIAILISTL